MSNLKVALIQFAPVWENPKESLARLDVILNKIDTDTELVLLPEMFNTGFSMNTSNISETMDGLTNQWLKTQSERFIITGSLAIQTDKGFANRICVYSKGELLGYYDKKYLFTLGKEDEHFTTGNEKLELDIKGFKFQFFICYDLRFAEWIRNYSEYDCAVFMASWPKKRMPHWDALLKARAIENQSYVLAINRTGTDGNNIEHIGHSMVIEPFGDIAELAENEETIIYHTLQKEKIERLRKTLPFLKDIKN